MSFMMLRYRINNPVTATQVTWGLDGMTLGSRGLMSPLYMAVTANQLSKIWLEKSLSFWSGVYQMNADNADCMTSVRTDDCLW